MAFVESPCWCNEQKRECIDGKDALLFGLPVISSPFVAVIELICLLVLFMDVMIKTWYTSGAQRGPGAEGFPESIYDCNALISSFYFLLSLFEVDCC